MGSCVLPRFPPSILHGIPELRVSLKAHQELVLGCLLRILRSGGTVRVEAMIERTGHDAPCVFNASRSRRIRIRSPGLEAPLDPSRFRVQGLGFRV